MNCRQQNEHISDINIGNLL